MLKNNFLDPQSVSEYHSEYLKLINFYKNFKRPSVFVKYYNINYDYSTYDNDTRATYDIYTTSKIIFDVYDLTPTYMINPIVNATSNITDMAGQMFESTTTIVIYTVERPRINDVVMFYNPVNSNEIYRVSNFRVPINMLYANDDSVFFYELDLEIAPFNDINQLEINNMYVYDLSEEKYLSKQQYIDSINKLNRLNEIIDELLKFYDHIRDVYRIENNIPLITNQVIYTFKKQFSLKNKRLFEHVYTPYGLTEFVPKQENNDIDVTKINDSEFTYNQYKLYNFYKRQFDQYDFYIDQYSVDSTQLDIKYMLYLTKQLYNEL